MSKELKTLYATGCSHTAAGGLWWPQSIEWYGKNHNIFYKNEKDVAYPKVLADLMELKCVNTAKSGTGARRLIRKTWQYIREVGLDEAKKTLFFLQINNPTVRLDFYSKELNCNLVVNCRYDDKGNIDWIETCDSHPNPTKSRSYFKSYNEDFKHYLENYHSILNEYDILGMEFIGLISFFKLHNIDFFIEATDGFFYNYMSETIYTPDFKNKHIVMIENQMCLNLWAYANKKLIHDETNGYSGDNHAGLFAQIEWAEKLKKFIEERL
jgi:hypothetical protein